VCDEIAAAAEEVRPRPARTAVSSSRASAARARIESRPTRGQSTNGRTGTTTCTAGTSCVVLVRVPLLVNEEIVVVGADGDGRRERLVSGFRVCLTGQA
jgi:hypothetical protein